MDDGFLFALSDEEREMKQLYLSGYQSLLSKPMTLDDYQKYLSRDKNLPDSHVGLDKADGTNQPVTYRKIGKYSAMEGIEVTGHIRYSYPILHNHSFFEIVYVYSGGCINYISGRPIEMNTGDFCFMAPSTTHALTTGHDEDVVINLIIEKDSFEKYFMELIREKHVIGSFYHKILLENKVNPYILFRTAGDSELKQQMFEICLERKREKYAYKEALALRIRLLFIELLRKYELTAVIPADIEAGTEQNIMAMLGYIAVNYQTVTLKKLSEFAGYNESYLSRMLKKETGKNFENILTELRIRKATEFLTETEMTVSAISQETGFSDASHFNKKFKNFCGMTPLEYRKKNAGCI